MQPRPQLRSAHRLASLAFVAALTTPWMLAGCGSPGHSLCTQTCNCTGCATTALQSCELTADGNDKTAAQIGCAGEYDTYVSCLVSQGQCIGTEYKISGCDVESSKANNCLSSAKCNFGFDAAIHCK